MSDLAPAQPRLLDREIDRFFFNKSLQQQGLEWRAGEIAHDIRSDIRRVGAAIVQQQERAAQRYGEHATKLAGEVGALRKQEAANAERLQEAVAASAQMLRQGLQENQHAIERVGAAISDQLTSVRFALAEQHETLRGIYEVLRNSRSNECRQLLEQGDRSLRAGFLDDARERYALASAQDGTNMLVWQQLGRIAVQMGAFTEAEAHFRKGLAFAPPEHPHLRASAATHLARLYYATERWSEAEAAFERAVADDPSGGKNWYDLAIVRAPQGNAGGTVEALRRAIEIDAAFYGLALSDGELDPVRDAVEHALIVDLPRELDAAIASARADLRAFVAQIRAVEVEVGAPLLLRGDADAADALLAAPIPSHVPAMLLALRQLRWTLRGFQSTVKDAARKEADRADRAIEDLMQQRIDLQPNVIAEEQRIERELARQLAWKLRGAAARQREARRLVEERAPALRAEMHATFASARDAARARALRLRRLSNGLWA